MMQICSPQVALKEKDANNVSALAEELKVQNEQLNAKVIQLKKQLASSEKLKLENQQLKDELHVMKHMEGEFLKMVSALHMDLMEKERALRDSADFNQSLIIKERETNVKPRKARKKLMIMVLIIFFMMGIIKDNPFGTHSK